VGISDDAYDANGPAMTPEEAVERKTRTVKLQFNLPTGARMSEDIVSIAQLCKDVDAMVRERGSGRLW
jgi:acetyl-CoA carboxylase beta subunit